MNNTIETETPQQRIERQWSRGEFAWWPKVAEAAWKALNPPRPGGPRLLGTGLVCIYPNQYVPGWQDDYADWQKTLEAGRSYMVGTEVPMEKYIRTHRSALTSWQQIAYWWVRQNPYWKLQVDTGGGAYEWEVYVRGQYVTFALPHQDHGGERHYVTRDGRTKILVNVD